jgi:hypothetical protein
MESSQGGRGKEQRGGGAFCIRGSARSLGPGGVGGGLGVGVQAHRMEGPLRRERESVNLVLVRLGGAPRLSAGMGTRADVRTDTRTGYTPNHDRSSEKAQLPIEMGTKVDVRTDTRTDTRTGMKRRGGTVQRGGRRAGGGWLARARTAGSQAVARPHRILFDHFGQKSGPPRRRAQSRPARRSRLAPL